LKEKSGPTVVEKPVAAGLIQKKLAKFRFVPILCAVGIKKLQTQTTENWRHFQPPLARLTNTQHMKVNYKKIISAACCAALLAGCAQQQQQGKYKSESSSGSTTKAVTAPMTAAKAGASSAYFPSGQAGGSGLLLEKSAPAEVLAGQPYEYTYKVSNLTDATLENVVVNDRVGSNFTATDSDPKATSSAGGIASWNLGSLGPKETKMITVKGSSAEEGVVTTCGYATYNPVACQDIHIVKANIELTKNEPADELICDPIPVTITVKNTGTSKLTGVKVADMLPAGMTSDSKSELAFDAGTLAPGESKEFKYNAAASATGKLVNTAKATSDQGVSAEASASTTVHQPVLAVSCKAQDQQFMGRKFDVCYTVSNTGDAPAAGTKLEVSIPAGLNVVSTTGSATVNGGKITWDLGSVDAANPQNVCVTLTGANGGSYDFAGTAKGACAAAVSTTCSTKVVGIPAILLEKSDDPDPVAVGDTTTYTVKVTNQGSADDHNVQIVVEIAPELAPVSSSEGSISGQTVTMPVVPTLAPKAAVTYKIVAKGVTAGDGHTLFKLTSDVLKSQITAEESTHVY
jgi:uncharacterized repeat protein (TIGR01451 family)